MSARFLVWDHAEADADFQGIDFVTLKLWPNADAPTSAELTIHLQNPAVGTFTAESFTLTGGRRIRALPFTLSWQGGSTVVLDIAGVGDPSPYTITMVDGAGAPVHPFFASATFSFAIDCERGDCRPLAEQAARRPRERPAVDLLTKDYAGFLSLTSEWIKVRNPHLADLSPASLERVLVELLSHHGDMLSYYQDRVANEAFIEDASARHSLRQHGTLLGTAMFDGTAAETVLAFDASELGSNQLGYVVEGTEVTTAQDAVDARVVFHVTERTRVVHDHFELPLAAWPGAVDAVIPAGATEVLLYGAVAGLLVGQRLAFVQGQLGQPGSTTQIVAITSIVHDALPGWVADPTQSDPSSQPVAVTIVGFEPPLWRSCTPWTGQGLAIRGNLATARFGERKQSTIRLSARECAERQDFLVEERGLGLRPRLRALRVPLGPVVHRAVTGADGVVTSVPLLEVMLGTEPWIRVPHLHGSQPYDRHYVATADEDGAVWIELGDGLRGRAIELTTDDSTLEELVLEYYVGEVVAGNCGAGVLRRFLPEASNLARLSDFATLPAVLNVLPGVGGRQAETKDAARLRIPASLRHGPLQRAVTLEDYAAVARSVEGVARAVATDVGGPFNAVLVLCDPEGRSELSPAVARAVHERLDAVRMAGREHFVRAPTYVPIEVVLSVCTEPGSVPHRVRNAVLAALLPGRDDAPGFFHPDALSFGEDLELADVIATVQRIPGVRSVKARRFRRADVLGGALVHPRIGLAATEVARMDGDPRVPEHGRLAVHVDGIDPGLDDPSHFEPYLVEESP